MKYSTWSSLGALVFGLGVVGVSLVRTGSAQALGSSNTNLSSSQMYVGEIGPDHVLYPLVGLKDNVEIQFMSPVERAKTHVQMAQHKQEHVDRLIAEKHPEMAVETLIKIQQHLLIARDICQQEICPADLTDQIGSSLKTANLFFESKRSELPEQFNAQLEDISEFYQATVSSLRNS